MTPAPGAPISVALIGYATPARKNQLSTGAAIGSNSARYAQTVEGGAWISMALRTVVAGGGPIRPGSAIRPSGIRQTIMPIAVARARPWTCTKYAMSAPVTEHGTVIGMAMNRQTAPSAPAARKASPQASGAQAPASTKLQTVGVCRYVVSAPATNPTANGARTKMAYPYAA